jgi:hypothetical protein
MYCHRLKVTLSTGTRYAEHPNSVGLRRGERRSRWATYFEISRTPMLDRLACRRCRPIFTEACNLDVIQMPPRICGLMLFADTTCFVLSCLGRG